MTAIRFTKHALERLFTRRITPAECEVAVRKGRVIESYPDDVPFPSELRLCTIDTKVIHIVVALEPDSVHVVTAYEPDPARWTDGFTRRR